MCGPPVPAAAPVHGAVGQQDLSSLPTAATALRAHCSPTVPRPLRLCFESHQCPRSPHASAARLHTCSPRRAPSPSLVMTPCDSEYGLDHRTRAGIAPQVPASARIRSDEGLGAGPRRGGGACSGAGSGRGWPSSGPLTPPGGRAMCTRYCSSPCILGVPPQPAQFQRSSPEL